ncbi:hypothetical protein OIU84_023133 [Salix udensis]|uniref:Uncharacterized protein n=1 Tax=Salix udensis TaxID=889485 RepID=A0AAD6PF89_9ROSI|nr:hypothetical protein OIU84_023133 [Salix udensis]
MASSFSDWLGASIIQYTFACDALLAGVWSCGVTLGVMLVGAYPFEDPKNFRKTINAEISLRRGDYAKPELSKGWRNYVTDYELIRVGDRVVLLAEEDHRLGSQYRIEAKRRIILFGHEVWSGLPRAN